MGELLGEREGRTELDTRIKCLFDASPLPINFLCTKLIVKLSTKPYTLRILLSDFTYFASRSFFKCVLIHGDATKKSVLITTTNKLLENDCRLQDVSSDLNE